MPTARKSAFITNNFAGWLRVSLQKSFLSGSANKFFISENKGKGDFDSPKAHFAHTEWPAHWSVAGVRVL